MLKNLELSLINILAIELCDFLLVVTFARDDPTRLDLHGTSDVDRTLLLLDEDSPASSLIALDSCEWPRTSPTSRAVVQALPATS